MKIPEMKVVTRTNICNDSLYDINSPFFDPGNKDIKLDHPYHNVLLAEHFKNVVISNVCNLFDASARKLIPELNALSRTGIYEAVYESWCECYNTSDNSYAKTATQILAESICSVLMSEFEPSYIDSKRQLIVYEIYKALPKNYFEI